MRWWVFLVCSALVAEEASDFNEAQGLLKAHLKEQFDAVKMLSERGAESGDYAKILSDVKLTRAKMQEREEAWRKEASAQGDEPAAFWDVGETTLSQLVMEYGAGDYLYVIPQELAGMKISLYSGLALPRESWSEMIEMILAQNGVGAKRLNAFVKQLYILKLDPSAVEAILTKEQELPLFAPQGRLCFIFAPQPEQLKSVQAFFERFSDPKQTLVQAIGSKVAIVASRETIEKLLGLYRAVWEQNSGKTVRMASLLKFSPQEGEKILKAAFSDPKATGRPPYYPSGADELAMLVLPQGLALVGEANTVGRAQQLLNDLEAQMEDPGEKVIYWYTCKHSNPDEIAEVLDKVYASLTCSGFEKPCEVQAAPVASPPPPPTTVPTIPEIPGFTPAMPATAPFVQPEVGEKEKKTVFGNFIVDHKTTSILMVVKRDELTKIKSLLKKLDVPKRMVQLDVLLVEKKLHDNRELGFNLLQIGANASGKKETSINYNADDPLQFCKDGLLSFIFSRPNGRFPAADMKFNFLLAQEDVRIKQNPSILAINQTAAKISIVDEISINNGAFPVSTQQNLVTYEKSFTRAQYGITIQMTPTIHIDEEEAGTTGFVSLETALEFDSMKMISLDDRPPVTRRHIENEVRVADGETIILGGLRQQIEEETREKLPFLGDLPGFGKLFGTTRTHDMTSEMFIFITPRIIRDPVEDLRRIREADYAKRPGDIPEFLERIDEAKELERKRLFRQSLKLLFDL